MKKIVLKIINHLLSIFLLLSLFNIVPNASAKSILMSYYTNNGIINSDLYYGSSEWSKMTSAVEDGGENQVTFTANFKDLTFMLQFDALWLQKRDVCCLPNFNYSGTLSNIEINNIKSFINTGRRVVMIGEWGGWPYGSELGWQDWNNQILSTVGGSYDSAYGDDPVAINPVSIINHEFTEGVNELELIGNRYGAANGGLALFMPNFATLWGNIDNVLTVLDTGVFDDSRWDLGDNGQFATNVAHWITTTEPVSILEILYFFDQYVAAGTLEGYGPGNSANGRLNALRNMLEMAGDLINIGDIEGACGQLRAALRKCDGDSPPPDFVTGEAVTELNNMIVELMEELGCE